MIKITEMIEPMFNRIVVTHRRYTEEELVTMGGLFMGGKQGLTMEYQEVLAVGPQAHGIEVGDLVCIDPSRYLQLIHKEGKTSIDKKVTADDMRVAAVFPLETIYTKDKDGIETSKTVMVIYDSDVIYKIPKNGWENFHPKIITNQGNLIMPGKDGVSTMVEIMKKGKSN